MSGNGNRGFLFFGVPRCCLIVAIMKLKRMQRRKRQRGALGMKLCSKGTPFPSSHFGAVHRRAHFKIVLMYSVFRSPTIDNTSYRGFGIPCVRIAWSLTIACLPLVASGPQDPTISLFFDLNEAVLVCALSWCFQLKGSSILGLIF